MHHQWQVPSISEQHCSTPASSYETSILMNTIYQQQRIIQNLQKENQITDELKKVHRAIERISKTLEEHKLAIESHDLIVREKSIQREKLTHQYPDQSGHVSQTVRYLAPEYRAFYRARPDVATKHNITRLLNSDPVADFARRYGNFTREKLE